MSKTEKTPPIKPYRKGIIDELIGFDESEVERLIRQQLDRGGNKDVKGVIRKELGKVSRNKREIIRQRKSVLKHMELLEKYVNRMVDSEDRYMKMMRWVNPKVTIKRPTKSFKSYRGKVYWGVSRYVKRGWIEFYIISEKKVKQQSLTEEQIREIGKQKFIEKMTKDNLMKDVFS